jgi:putative membrane protein
VPLTAIAVAGLLYVRRARTLERRGHAPAPWQAWCFALSLATLFVAVASPIDAVGEERLFSVHMLQHLLIGDVAPLLAVLGLGGALLRPPAGVALLGRLRLLAAPLLVIPLWAVNLFVWHVPALYDAALAHPALHALQHLLLFGCGVLLWGVLLGLVAVPGWYRAAARVATLAFVWLAGSILANVLLWAGHSFYTPYRRAPRLWGLSPVADQRLGGGLMMLEMSIVVVVVGVLLGVRWFEEGERLRPGPAQRPAANAPTIAP